MSDTETRDRMLVAEATANEILARRNAVEAALMVRQAVEKFNKQTSKQTRHLIILTYVIAALTLVMALLVYVQWEAYRDRQQSVAPSTVPARARTSP